MRVGVLRKGADDRRDYDIGFDQWLPEGDSLIDVEATIEDAPDASLVIDAASVDGTDAKVWLSGGTENLSYKVEARVTTAQGRIKVACFTVRITSC